jgi:hypothetical protein
VWEGLEEDREMNLLDSLFLIAGISAKDLGFREGSINGNLPKTLAGFKISEGSDLYEEIWGFHRGGF